MIVEVEGASPAPVFRRPRAPAPAGRRPRRRRARHSAGVLARHVDDRDDVAADLLDKPRPSAPGTACRTPSNRRRAARQKARRRQDRARTTPHDRARAASVGGYRRFARARAAATSSSSTSSVLPRSRKVASSSKARSKWSSMALLARLGDKKELLDAGRLGLFDGVMDQRLVDDRQHFLWHRLGRRQKPGARARRPEIPLCG